MDLSEDDQISDTTDPMDNTAEQLLETRVDIKIKIPPSETPEATTAYVLQQLLITLKTYDPKAIFAPWQTQNKTKPIFSHTDMPTRPSEL